MPSSDALLFEQRDTGVFTIPDLRTRLDTLQNYFFPRLQRLVEMSVEIIHEIYQLDPYDNYSFVYRPAHRKKAKEHVDTGKVYLGIAPKRIQGRLLSINKQDGSPYSIHPAALYIKVVQSGGLQIELELFNYSDSAFVATVKNYFRQHQNSLEQLLAWSKCSLETDSLAGLSEILTSEDLFYISSPVFYFPIQHLDAIGTIGFTHSALFPIMEAVRQLAEGNTPNIAKWAGQLKEWIFYNQGLEEEPLKFEQIAIPELESYRFIRDRLWFQILARDQWTCCSCGRSSRINGIVLHVDHIVPRSLGGKDEINNLQTLCMKCNLGKSNLDSTDLRK